MAEKIQLEKGLELWQIGVEELKEQNVNARAMPGPMFQRLTETIKRDARLESFPFCALTDKGIEIVSGHHRVRASRAAGVTTVWAIVDTTGLTKSQIKAKQLAHNAISGKDDPAMLAEIFHGMDDISDIQESFIFDADMAKLDKVKLNEITADLEPRTVYLMFVPSYYDKWEYLARTIPPAIDQVAVVDAALEEKFRGALKTIGKAFNIKATTPIVCKMIDMVNGDTESVDGWHYLADIFGPKVPAEVGALLTEVVRKMKENKDITDKNKWQALEYIAADWLSR